MKVFYSLALVAAAALSANAAEPVNLLTNPTFANEGEGWQNITKPQNGNVSYNSDGSLTISTGNPGGDNIVSQVPAMEQGKRYVFTVEWQSANTNNQAFAGFWKWNGEKPAWTGGMPYADLGNSDGGWKRQTNYVAPSTANEWCVVLAANKVDGEITYKNPAVFEVPQITLTSNDAPVYQGVTIGTTVDVTVPEGFDVFYQYGSNEAVAVTDGSFVAAQAGAYTVSVVYANITLNSVTIYAVASVEGTNLMPNAIPTADNLKTPGFPWLAYNTSSNTFGNGNGWQFRNSDGDKEGTGDAAQLFLRWGDTNSTWIYAYPVVMKKGYSYKLTLKAATNDDKPNNLLIGLTDNLADIVNMGVQSFELTGHNGGADDGNGGKTTVWSVGIDVVANLIAETDGVNFIVFKSTNLGGNIIIRTADFELTETGVADYEPIYNAYVQTIKDALAALMEKDDAATEFAQSTSWGVALTDLLYAENIDDYEKAYNDLKAAYAIFNDVYPVLASYFNASQEAIKIAGMCGDADADKLAALTSAAQLGYSNATIAQMQEAVSKFTQLEREVVESNAICEGIEDAVNMTDAIENPGCTDEVAGWTSEAVDGSSLTMENMTTNNGQSPTLANGTKPAKYFDHWSADAWCNDFSQTVTLPAGEYRLSVFARGSQTDNLAMFELYAGDESVELEHINGEGGLFGNGWNMSYVDFNVAAPAEETRAEGDSDVQIGVRTVADGGGIWVSFVDFQLVQMKNHQQTGVAEIEAAEGEAEYYDLNGMKVSGKLAKGVYVKRQGGKATKVIM